LRHLSIEEFIPPRTYSEGIFNGLPNVVNLLNKIINNCPNLNGNDFLLAPSKIPGSIVDGYEIHITGEFTDAVRIYLSDLALKKKLSITQHPNSIMIYSVKSIK
jgi:hypothetical protein